MRAPNFQRMSVYLGRRRSRDFPRVSPADLEERMEGEESLVERRRGAIRMRRPVRRKFAAHINCQHSVACRNSLFYARTFSSHRCCCYTLPQR